jgi:hypothetical protein
MQRRELYSRRMRKARKAYGRLKVDSLLSAFWEWMSANGPIGVLCFFLLVAVYRLFDLYSKSVEARISDNAQSQVALAEVKAAFEAQKELLRDLIVELRSRRGK